MSVEDHDESTMQLLLLERRYRFTFSAHGYKIVQVYSFGGYCSGETMTNSQPIDVHELNTSSSYFYNVFSNILDNFRWRQVKPVNKQFLNADETFQEPENFGHVSNQLFHKFIWLF